MLEALSASGTEIRTDCGAKGICGKCRVKIQDRQLLSPVSPPGKKWLTREQIEEGVRLACQTRLLGDRGTGHEIFLTLVENIHDTMPEGSSKTHIQSGVLPLPLVSRTIVSPDAAVANPTDSLDQSFRLKHEPDPAFSLQALQGASRYFTADKEMTVVRRRNRVLSVLPGSRERSLGVAVDLGTTTTAAYLCDLSSGDILTAHAKTNSQKIHGHDVISRIEFASKSVSNLKKLQAQAIKDINELIIQSLEETGQSIDDIDDVCLVGNPTMQSVFAGISPLSIGRSPYVPATREPMDIPNYCLGLCVRKDVNIHVFPMPSAFIGGDAVAAATAAGVPESGGSLLVVDLGTNGELIIINGSEVFAASAATGPAFEGYSISCGVRAVPGAVNKVRWDLEKQAFDFELIPGNPGKKAVGLCGSAIIDALAEAGKIHRIQSSGRITQDAPGVTEEKSGRVIRLTGRAQDRSTVHIKLTQKDVRQIQLAKAALRVGIDLLLEAAGLATVDKTIFTGAFGANFNWENAGAIGMVPRAILKGKIETMNNAAGLGAVHGLLNRTCRRQAQEFAKTIQCIKLETQPEFSYRFALASKFNPAGA